MYAGTIPHQVQVADHINTTESSRVDFQGLWIANNALDITNKQKEPILAVANIHYFTRNIVNFIQHVTLPPKKEGAIRGKEDVELFSFGSNTVKDKLINYIPENVLENKFANTNY